jgi:phosphoglycolate phosphatase-like HAD superfamily hydrolase
VGDALDDIGMARAAGMRSIGVRWGVAELDLLVEAGASESVTDPGHLARVLTRLLQLADPADAQLQDVR